MASDSDWTARKATDEIRAIARSDKLTVSYKKHARERISERDLIMSDVLYVLKNGFVHMEPIPSTRPGYNKYAMECRCPNGGNRAVRVVTTPEKKACFLKIVTVMWVDEQEIKTGSIIGADNE